ncbi:MAG: hypothetical protein IT293_14030 [Deltaproteobacteria bacterium]|nr:hypothetical protein [Deltaproteobacteria bacterium]
MTGPTLEAMVERELDATVPEGAHRLAERLRLRFGAALRAVVMYGSNLRRGDDDEGVLDLYALVSSYPSAYPQRPGLAMINRLLPPNVFYMEVQGERHPVRCKYAVLALDDLPRLTSRHTAEPYFWARFAQPCALVWAADVEARALVVAAFAGAIRTFVRFAVPFADERFDARALWTRAWRATYGAEIRPERPGAAEVLWAANAARFVAATALALPSVPWPVAAEAGAFTVALPPRERRRALRAWRVRRLRAKAAFLLRILRNAMIFEGGVDYVLWKIQRHAGVAVTSDWRQRRHPLLALGAEAWRLYRAGAFR